MWLSLGDPVNAGMNGASDPMPQAGTRDAVDIALPVREALDDGPSVARFVAHANEWQESTHD